MSTRIPSVLEALFGDLPPEVRNRYGLPDPAGQGTPAVSAPQTTTPHSAPQDAQSGGASNAAIKAQKDATNPQTAGNGPSSAWQLSKGSWLAIIKRLYGEIAKDRVMSVAAGVTFFGLLALFPAITAFVSLYGLFFDTRTILDHMAALQGVLPEGAIGIMRDQITALIQADEGALGIAAIAGLLVALYSANGGIKALIESLNVAWFETEKRGFIRLNLVSLAMTLGAILFLLVMLGLTAVVPVVLQHLPFGHSMERLVSLARWPVMALALTLALAVLYRWGPSKEDSQWHWITPGAIFATFGLILASVLFSWYAANFANYNETYGALGAAIGLMMWLWIAAMVVMMGAEINAEVERQIQMENGIPLEDDRAKSTAD